MKRILSWSVCAAVAGLACDKSEEKPGSTAEKAADGAKAAEASAASDEASLESPSGPATIVHPPESVDVDPCPLITDEEAVELTGDEPKIRKRKQIATALVGAKPEQVVASCDKGRVDIELGGKGINPRDYEDVAPIDGVGDEAKHVKDRGNRDVAWVRVGDRIAVVGAHQKFTQGGEAAAKRTRDRVQKVAELVASRLADLPAYEHHQGDLVGGPAKDPCELLDAKDVAWVTGPVEVLQVSSSETGNPKNGEGSDHVSCSWYSTKDGDMVKVGFRRPIAYERPYADSKPGPTIHGAATKIGKSALSTDLVADKGDYAVQIIVTLESDREKHAPAILEVLADKVLARLN